VKHLLNTLQFAILLLVLVYVQCSSGRKSIRNDVLLAWKQKQINESFKVAQNHPEYIVGLGLKEDKDKNTAIERAKWDADWNLSKIAEIYVRTLERTVMVYNDSVSDPSKIVFLGSSSVIKRSENYEILNEVTIEGVYCVAVNSFLGKEELLNDYIQYIEFSNTVRMIEFRKMMEEKFAKELENKSTIYDD